MSFTVTILQHFHYDVTIKIMLAISKLQDAFLVTSHGYKGNATTVLYNEMMM